MSSFCGAEVRYCAPVDRYHVDRGDQGVGQLLVPVLQPLDKLGDLQAVLAFFAFVDSLVWVTIVGRALENETKGMNKTESLWHLPRIKVQSNSRECARRCVYVHDANMAQCRNETMTNKLMVLLKQTIMTDTNNSLCIIYHFAQSGSALTCVHILSYLGPMGEGGEVNLLNPS